MEVYETQNEYILPLLAYARDFFCVAGYSRIIVLWLPKFQLFFPSSAITRKQTDGISKKTYTEYI